MLQKIDDKVFLSNDPKMEFKHELASLQFYLTEIEKNIIVALYSEIDHQQSLNSTIFTKRISFSELAKICGLTTKDYSKIKRAVWSIFTVRYVREIGASKLSGWRWLVNVEINQEGKYVDFDWNPKIVDLFLFDSKEGLFISAKRDTLIDIKGDYAYRFYLWFRQWINNRHEKIFKLRYIADALDLPKSYYDDKYPSGINAGQIKGKIIDPSIAKLANSDIEATAEYLRNGRHIESVKFRFWWRNSQITTDTVAKPVEKPKKERLKLNDEQKIVFDEILQFGISKKDAKNFVLKKPLDVNKIIIEYIKKKEAAGKINDIANYAYSAFKGDYGVAEARAAAQAAAAAAAKEAERLKNLTPEEREEEEQRKQWTEEENKKQKPAETPKEKEQTPEEKEKEAIKAEFLNLASEEQKNYLMLARKEVENETNPFCKVANKKFLKGDLADILSDNTRIRVLINYIYQIRHAELKVKE